MSGSLGLGHINRDLAIADHLRRINPAIDIEWLAAHPATERLVEAGERFSPDINEYTNDNIPAEQSAGEYKLNLIDYLMKARKGWNENYELVKGSVSRYGYDLVIGDETYELVVGYGKEPEARESLFVMIFDFIGLDSMTKNPLEKLGVHMWNRVWSMDYKKGRSPSFDLALFVGEREDVPDRSFGFLLPNRRVWAESLCSFVGYVLPFHPADYADQGKVRNELGYGAEPLVLCSVGGTAVGKDLLQLCADAYDELAAHISGVKIPSISAQMIFIIKFDPFLFFEVVILDTNQHG